MRTACKSSPDRSAEARVPGSFMARNQSNLVNWAQYIPLRVVAAALQCFPIGVNMQTAAGIGSLFYRTVRRRREAAERNIAASFPDWSPSAVAETAEQSMRHMFQLFIAEAAQMPTLISPTSWQKYVRFRGVDRVLDCLIHSKPMVFVTGHCGNWELLGYLLSALGYPITALARPLDNPLINEWVLGIRQQYGLHIITKWGAVPELQGIASSGGSIGFIADQNAGDRGMFVPFFGRLASTYKSIGLLAMRYDIPIAAMHARRLDGGFQYEITATDIIEPQEWKDQEDPLFYITARYSRALEMMVRAAPEQYLWLHRRWKSRPQHEIQGESMPKKLRDRLQALPWMTSDALARLEAV